VSVPRSGSASRDGTSGGTPACAFPSARRRRDAGRAHGIDVDPSGNGTTDYQRMYQLIRQSQPIGDRLFEIEFLDAGVEAFAFTFG